MADKTLFELKDISVQFGGLRASDHVSFDVKEGEIFGLIGPNGAGKTTIFNVITGSITPVEGDILLDGKSLLKLSPDKIARSGISRTFQNIRLFPKMSVAENIAIGFHCTPMYSRLEALLGLPSGGRAEKEVQRKTAEMLEIFGLTEYAGMRAGNLAYGLQRKLEIARAIATGAKILLLDEPAAGMNPTETAELMEAITLIRTRFGVSILLIEHDMSLVMSICERLIVIDYGQIIAAGTPYEVANDPKVIGAYLGQDEEGMR